MSCHTQDPINCFLTDRGTLSFFCPLLLMVKLYASLSWFEPETQNMSVLESPCWSKSLKHSGQFISQVRKQTEEEL